MGSKPRGISASRGAAVLGLSEYQTPFEVWQRIMEERQPGFNAAHGYAMPPEPDSAAMRWGTVFESAVIELAEQAQGKNIIHRERYDEAPRMEYVTCHLDGVYSGTDALIHEGKTTSAMTYREKWGQPGTDHIPRSYQVQVQHQMMCTGADECIVSVLVFPEIPDKWEQMGIVIENESMLINGNSLRPMRWARILAEMGYFHQYHIRANPEVQKHLVSAYSKFWQDNVLTGKPPEPRNYDDIKRLCPEPVGTIVCDTQMTAWILEYNAIAKELSKTGNAAKRQEKLKLRILNQARKMNPVMDDESQEKVIFRDTAGNKLKQYSAKGGFR